MLTRLFTRARATFTATFGRKPRYAGRHALDHLRATHKLHAAGAVAAAGLIIGGSFGTYTVRAGDTLSSIAAAHCSSASAWTSLYAASHGDLGKDPNLIFPGQRVTLDCTARAVQAGDAGPAAPSLLAGEEEAGLGKARAASHPVASAGTRRPVTSSLSGTLGCAGLEALWQAAGGRAGAAFTAAEIAMAESGGNQFAHSPTNDFGYWQINGVHGQMATFDPMGNARAAVSISGDGADWNPWTTFRTGAYQGKCSGGITTTAALAGSSVSGDRASRALAWARTQAGKPYQWGGSGPWSYDCSGLVMAAYARAGVRLPHNTVAMLYSGHLHRTWSPRPGDLVMWGGGSPYHVELYDGGSLTWGAHKSGTVVSIGHLWGSYAFYRVS